MMGKVQYPRKKKRSETIWAWAGAGAGADDGPATRAVKREGEAKSGMMGKVQYATKKKRAGEEADDGPAAKAVKGGGGEAKSVYIYFRHSDGPFVHSLYAVDNVAGPKRRTTITTTEELSPILKFSSAEYPKGMACVEYDSRWLFFIGGEFIRDHYLYNSDPFPRDVHIFDTHSRKLLDPSPPPKMKSGKPYPLAFVAKSKIFVLSALTPYHDNIYKIPPLSRFEVLEKENNGGNGKWNWKELADPPFTGLLMGHTLIGDKLFVLTMLCSLYSFDVNTYLWCNVNPSVPSCSQFLGKAVYLEDTLYRCSEYSDSVTSTTCSSKGKEELLFNTQVAYMLRNVVDLPFAPTNLSSASLTHLEGNILCHACAGCLALDFEYPKKNEMEKWYVKLTTFEALKGTYIHQNYPVYKSKLLHSLQFVIHTFPAPISLINCFALPSITMEEGPSNCVGAEVCT